MEQITGQPRAALQRQILDRLLLLERLTTEMLTCLEEQLPDRLAQRQALMDEITALVENGETAAQEPADPAQDELVRELTGQCRAVACRMQELDRQAVARMRNLQDQILQKIRTVGKSAGAHAARYYVPSSGSKSAGFTGSV